MLCFPSPLCHTLRFKIFLLYLLEHSLCGKQILLYPQIPPFVFKETPVLPTRPLVRQQLPGIVGVLPPHGTHHRLGFLGPSMLSWHPSRLVGNAVCLHHSPLFILRPFCPWLLSQPSPLTFQQLGWNPGDLRRQTMHSTSLWSSFPCFLRLSQTKATNRTFPLSGICPPQKSQTAQSAFSPFVSHFHGTCTHTGLLKVFSALICFLHLNRFFSLLPTRSHQTTCFDHLHNLFTKVLNPLQNCYPILHPHCGTTTVLSASNYFLCSPPTVFPRK